MNKRIGLAFALVVLGTGAAMADHNSKWGEGTALDPLGMHDARYDSLADTSLTFDATSLSGPVELLEPYARQDRPDTIDTSLTGGGSLETVSLEVDAGSSAGGQGGGSGRGTGGR